MYTHRCWFREEFKAMLKRNRWTHQETADKLGIKIGTVSGFCRPTEFTYPQGPVLVKMFAMLLRETGGSIADRVPAFTSEVRCPKCGKYTAGPPQASWCSQCGKKL